ncbi:replication-relaxation family protein [Brevibacillus dissolubilis]|uniref:replication-relaxation family protein n=1 Tax=Brevibacillus dissolubilis TaxID=1844116 RepID=UPI0011177B18|nr:replication-relaxation family protein [Brevibacillus dissolubilis]
MKGKQRDDELLMALYEYRGLTVKQIKEVFYSDSTCYVYRRMHLLKKQGLVESQPIIGERGKKVGAFYYLTEKGLDRLEQQGLIERTRRARENKPSGRRLPYIVSRNELYTQLSPYGWKFVDGRDYKAQYQMNRGAMLKGGLIRSDGKEYAVYILEKNTREKTIKRMVNEINNSRLTNLFIFCHSQDVYNRIKQEDIRQMEVNLLPFQRGIKLLRRFHSEEEWLKLFRRYGEVIPVQNKFLFGKYLIRTSDGRELYLCNCLLNDVQALNWLLRYTYERYRQDGRGVLLLKWEGQDIGMERQRGYEHVEIVELTRDELMM